MSKRLTALAATAAMVAGGLVGTVVLAPSAAADTPNVVNPTSSTVSADALPTVQIDGVAWDQTVVGNTVYVAGQFTNARPAGAAPGTNQTSRNNLLAYDVTTGNLVTSFNPSLNAQAKTVAVSPDGKRLYVGGTFTQVGGVNRYRIAAFDTATGQLISNFSPAIDATVNSIVATNTTVYVAGTFSKVGATARPRLAAFNASNGALLSWAPTADATARALVLSPDGQSIIVGGSFANVNGSPAYGLAKIDATTGALIPWATNTVVRNAGANAGIYSLTTDGTSIYGTGYAFGPGGNLEGTFKADPASGAVQWIEDCHGDTYDAWVGNGNVYTVSHAHYCGNIGGFPQSDPWSVNMRHALAFTTSANTTIGHDPLGYYDWYGNPAPAMINWFPDLAVGSFTGQTQAAWTVAGNGSYVVLGGEFPSVNGTAQQGLVRFAVRSIASNKSGPQYAASQINPTVVAVAGAARVSWQANTDRDDKSLTYTLTRDGQTVFTTTADSTFWDRPGMGYLDKGLTPGQSYKYRLKVSDPNGNTVQSENVTFTATAGAGPTAYTQRVLADGASTYWPLNEADGTTIYDNAGFTDAAASGTLTRGVAGAVAGDTSTTFGNAVTASTANAVNAPNTFTAQAWIKTTTTSGGKILGFGNKQTGGSTSYDRHIYMDNAGRIFFGVYPGSVAIVNSDAGYNDGQWHQVTASLGAGGMKLFIDGRLVGSRTDVTTGQPFSGYWRLGGDNIGGWPNQPASSSFNGTIDEVALYPTELTRAVIDAQWVASGRTSTFPAAPADPYGAAVYNDGAQLYWRLGESTGTTAADSSSNGDQTGSYQGGFTRGVSGALAGVANTATTYNGSDGATVGTRSFVNPTNYSEEAWFKTTTTSGGKIIGFGSSNSGRSSNYDRHVYMEADGRLTFGTWTGVANTISTTKTLNDGKWHQVVATQSSTDGMKLYVDGQLIGTNPQTAAQAYTGYWRVGGDSSWNSGSGFFAGSIDEASVYGTVLTADQVSTHFNRGTGVVTNQPPTAAFTSTTSGLTANVDASGSTDSDGTIASYAWDFGDGATGTGATASHAYATGGTKTVTLTVTDNKGATAQVSHTLSVTSPNQAPVASFTATAVQLAVTVDASGSSDPDGTVASYAWDFGDGATATGPTGSHTYATAGTKTVTLTVTDDKGVSSTLSQPVQVTAPPPNVRPTAGFTSTTDGLTANLSSTSTDSDGTVVAWSWDFGDSTPAITTENATHTYATAGTRQVTLTVTDNNGATATVTRDVTVTAPPPANQPPTADFTTAVDGLTASITSISTDPDGTVAAYAWNFGDNSTDIVSTPTASHTFATAGTYQVTLTVTDNSGATATVTKPVTVTSPAPTSLAADAFGRTISNAWGTADNGGAWTVSGGAANFSVSGGSGKVKLTAPGVGPSATLGALSSADVNLTMDVSLDKPATGGGVYVSESVRRVGNSEYRTTSKFLASGAVQLQLVKVVSGVSTNLQTVTVPGLTYAAGDVVTVRFQVTGTSTVSLKGKLWKAGTTEPAAWQVSATDATSPLVAAGGVALYPYLSGTATNAPVVVGFDNLMVSAVQQ